MMTHFSGIWILYHLINLKKEKKTLSILDPLWKNFLGPRMCFALLTTNVLWRNMQCLDFHASSYENLSLGFVTRSFSN